MAKKENIIKILEKGIENLVAKIEQKEPKKKKPLKPLIKIEEKHNVLAEKTKNEQQKAVESLKGISVKKNENFSQWYTEVVEKCELADIRYNVKGFLVFQPWSVLSMEKMYQYYEKALQKKGHKPYW